MTDEQLTRRAAEIMGIGLAGARWRDAVYEPEAGDALDEMTHAHFLTSDGEIYWPLHDTDQAMDLAAELCLDVCFDCSDGSTVTGCAGEDRELVVIAMDFKAHNGDKKAAMRRAIVECAGG